MGSRTDRAAALRRYAGRLDADLSLVRASLARLRLELRLADIDEEDRAAFEHDFEGAASALDEVIEGAFDAQAGRLFALAEGLDALEYAAATPPSFGPAAGRSSGPTGGRPEGYRDGVRPMDPDRRESRPRFLGFSDSSRTGVPYVHTWSSERFDGLGSPGGLRSFHRQQQGQNACAVVAQISVLESITGQRVGEADAAKRAEEMGIYAPAEGTPTRALGALLASYGVEVERREGCTVDELADALSRGDRVLVPLNAQEIWFPHRAAGGTVVPQIPPAGHAVWVTGIDCQDDRWTVLLNDSGRADGAMFAVSLDDFSQAWAEFDNLAVFARAPGA